MNDEGVERLRLAILRLAASDYMKALRDGSECKAAKIEHFFLSEWGELLSDGRGALLIEECRKRANSQHNVRKLQKPIDRF